MAEAHLRWTANTADAIAHIEALRAAIDGVDKSAGRSSSTSGGLTKLVGMWKILVPAVVAAGVAVLAFTGNMSVLAPLIPVLTVALTGLLVPFTTLAAVVVGFIPPVLLLTGLLGGLAAAFGFGLQKALTGNSPAFARLQGIVDKLQGRFAGLTRILAHDFMPIFIFLAGSAEKALNYLDKIAKLPLAQAFHSFATTGVAGLQKFLDHVGEILRKPLRLAFKVAFGQNDTLRKALVDDWNDIWAFLTKGPNSPGHFIATWFGKQDFTKTGYRWGSELAGAMVKAMGMALMKLLSSQGGKFILGGAGAGAAIGYALGGPIGAAMGLAIGAAIGIILNHYWPRIKAAGIAAFDAVGKFVKQAIGPKLWGQIISLAKSFWDTVRAIVRAIGGFIKNDVWPIVKRVWGALGGWHTVGVAIGGALRVLASIFVTVYGDVRSIYNWLKKAWDAVSQLAGIVGGALLSAFQTVAGIVGTIVSGIGTAVGLAERLASALNGGKTANPTLPQPGGHPIGGRGGVPPGGGGHQGGHTAPRTSVRAGNVQVHAVLSIDKRTLARHLALQTVRS